MFHLFLLLALAQGTPSIAESKETWTTKDDCISAYAEAKDKLDAKFEEKGITILAGVCLTEDEMNKRMQTHPAEKDAIK